VNLQHHCVIISPLRHYFAIASLFRHYVIVSPLHHCFAIASLFCHCVIVRALACAGRVAELNPYVAVTVLTDELNSSANLSYLTQFQVRVLKII